MRDPRGDSFFELGTFPGYRRADGTVGIRNHLAIIPSVICANVVVERVAAQVRGAIALPHPHGCAQVGDDVGLTERILAGAGANPNVGAVLVIGLGCETCQSTDVAQLIRTLAPGKRVESFSIQEAGGSIKSIHRGVEVARDLAATIATQERVPVSVRELIVATHCGGTDLTTDDVANPTVGLVADDLVRAGARVILGETPEWMDIAAELSARAQTDAIATRLREVVVRYRQAAHANGAVVIGTEAHDDVVAGRTTARSRALGCVAKGGSTPIASVLDFGVRADGPGLHLMDTPAHDAVALTAMAAGGAQVALGTTGRGSATGSGLMPVIKITGNRRTASQLADHIDLAVGHRSDRVADVADLRALLMAVCAGQESASEIIGHQDFAIHRVAPTV